MSLRAGVARVDLDPPLGLLMAGYPHLNRQLPNAPADIAGYFGREGGAIGTHDPLYARTLVLQNQERTLAICAVDLIGVTRAFTDQVRQAVAGATGIPLTHVLIGASHTHSGPDLLNWGGLTSAQTIAQIQAKVVESICRAHAALQPAALGYRNGTLDSVSINRRDPTGPIDPQVGVLTVIDEQEEPLAVVVNFAIHPIVLSAANLLYSGDIPGVVSATLERVYPGAVALFLNGAAGNINPVAYPGQEPKENIIPVFRKAWHQGLPHPRTARNLARLGHLIAAEAMRLLEQTSSFGDHPALGAASSQVQLPLRPPAELEQFRLFKGLSEHFSVAGGATGLYTTEVQALAVGDTLYVALPGEPFVELGLSLQARLAPANTYIVGFANDDARYVLPRAAYEDNRYENWSTMFVAGSGELLVEAGERVARVAQQSISATKSSVPLQ